MEFRCKFVFGLGLHSRKSFTKFEIYQKLDDNWYFVENGLYLKLSDISCLNWEQSKGAFQVLAQWTVYDIENKNEKDQKWQNIANTTCTFNAFPHYLLTREDRRYRVSTDLLKRNHKYNRMTFLLLLCTRIFHLGVTRN